MTIIDHQCCRYNHQLTAGLGLALVLYSELSIDQSFVASYQPVPHPSTASGHAFVGEIVGPRVRSCACGDENWTLDPTYKSREWYIGCNCSDQLFIHPFPTTMNPSHPFCVRTTAINIDGNLSQIIAYKNNLWDFISRVYVGPASSSS